MHAHGHSHGDGRAADRRALAVALALIVAFVVVEIVGGLVADSLALLADAGHMLSDALALGLALGASWLATRPATPGRSFGYRRAEILAALVNGAVLVAISVWILVEAGRRLGDEPSVDGSVVIAIGLAGLVVNLAAWRVLHARASESLNVRAAMLHVVADLLGSAGVVVAGTVIVLTGWEPIDAIASIVIAILIFWSAIGVLRESTSVLLEAAPAGLDVEAVGGAMAAYPGVVDVHDLHVWTITSGFPSLSAHVVVEASADCHAVRSELEHVLVERFGLTHTTLQVEHEQGLIQLGR